MNDLDQGYTVHVQFQTIHSAIGEPIGRLPKRHGHKHDFSMFVQNTLVLSPHQKKTIRPPPNPEGLQRGASNTAATSSPWGAIWQNGTTTARSSICGWMVRYTWWNSRIWWQRHTQKESIGFSLRS